MYFNAGLGISIFERKNKKGPQLSYKSDSAATKMCGIAICSRLQQITNVDKKKSSVKETTTVAPREAPSACEKEQV